METPSLSLSRSHRRISLRNLTRKRDPQSLKLLPLGSATLVRQYIVEFQDDLKQADWRRLARHHPTIACEILQDQIGASANIDQQLLFYANAIMPIIAKKEPDGALALITTLVQYVSLPQIVFQPLLILRPAAMIDLMIRAADGVEIQFHQLRNAFRHKIGVERLLKLIEKYPFSLTLDEIDVQDMELATCVELYNVYKYTLRDRQGRIATAIVDFLPATLREYEARRHLALPALQIHPDQRLAYVAFLPWEEVLTLVAPYLGSPSAELRRAALHALVKATYYQRSHLPDVLTIIKQRGQEQDPVRHAMLFDLAITPPGRWRQEHLDDLAQIVRDALNASDISLSTTSELYRLVLGLIPHYPDWSAEQLATILQRQGSCYVSSEIINELSSADVSRIVPALLPVLEEWEAHDNIRELGAIAKHFERHLHVFPGLFTVLERVVKRTSSTDFADKILPFFVVYQPERAALLIPDLLRDDPSWITRPTISTYLHTHRQDLLTPFLGQQAYRGRFSTGNTNFVLPIRHGFVRWTCRQQDVFARTLLAVMKDTGVRDATIRSAVKQLSVLPALPATHLIALIDDKRAVVRDTALFQLSKMDAGQGLPIVFRTLHDPSASNVASALRSLCMQIPLPQALTIFRQTSLEKVRIAKEVVRILATLPGEEAYQELLTFDRKVLHRDVRVVFLRSLWYHLDRDEVWQILERESYSLDSAIVLSVVHMSPTADMRQYRRMRRWRYRHRGYLHALTWGQGYANFSAWMNMNATRVSVNNLEYKPQQHLMHLFVLLLHHPQVEVRATVLNYCVRVAVADKDNTLLSLLLLALDSQNEEICKAAASAVFMSSTASDLPLIVECFHRLLPNRYALYTSVQVLQGAFLENRRRFLPIIRAILTVLASDPLTIKLQVMLIVTALPWSEVGTFLQEATTVGELSVEIFRQTGTFLLDGAVNRPDIADIGQLEAMLAISKDERLRHIALITLLVQVKVAKGWTPEWQARLRNYQVDPAPPVAAEAQFTFPSNVEG